MIVEAFKTRPEIISDLHGFSLIPVCVACACEEDTPLSSSTIEIVTIIIIIIF